MRLYLAWRDRDVVDFTLNGGRKLSGSLRVWEKTPDPPAAEPEGNGFHRGGYLASSERAGSMEPDTTTFGFNRRRW